MKLVRELTFRMEIDTDTHKGDIETTCIENGKEKTVWRIEEAMSVISVLSKYIAEMSENAVEFMVNNIPK